MDYQTITYGRPAWVQFFNAPAINGNLFNWMQIHDEVNDNHQMIGIRAYQRSSFSDTLKHCSKHEAEPITIGCKLCWKVLCPLCISSNKNCAQGQQHTLQLNDYSVPDVRLRYDLFKIYVIFLCTPLAPIRLYRYRHCSLYNIQNWNELSWMSSVQCYRNFWQLLWFFVLILAVHLAFCGLFGLWVF